MKTRISYKPAVFILAIIFVAPAVVSALLFLADFWGDRYRVRHSLDYDRIGEAGIELLTSEEDTWNRRILEPHEIPDALAETNPSVVQIYRDTVRLEFGGGFGHYGLVITKSEPDSDEFHRLAKYVYHYSGD